MGGRTWETWEAYWPHHNKVGAVSHGINVLPKFVPSTTLTDPTWQNTHVIKGDVEAAVRELKVKPGRALQVHGSGVPCAGGCSSATSLMSSTCCSTRS